MTLPSARPWTVLITCEHAGNQVPDWLADRFAGAAGVLGSHRGSDLGALQTARILGEGMGIPVQFSMTSRLIVDLNRSESSPSIFSEFTRILSPGERERILRDHYRPYRAQTERTVDERVRNGDRVMHLSVHTFTSELDGARRGFDAGILFDPGRVPEAAIAREWIGALRARDATLDIRENQPYLGTDDGLTTHLRTRFDAGAYSGIEIEVRNDLVREAPDQKRWGTRLASTLLPVLAR